MGWFSKKKSPLAQALAEAKCNPESRDVFYNLLLNSWVFLSVDPASGKVFVTHEEGSSLGTLYNEEKAAQFDKSKHELVRMQGVDFVLNAPPGVNFIFMVEDDTWKMFLAEEISWLKSRLDEQPKQ